MVVWGGSREERSGKREGAKGHEPTFADDVHVHALVFGTCRVRIRMSNLSDCTPEVHILSCMSVRLP